MLTYCNNANFATQDNPDQFIYTLTLAPAVTSGPLTIEVVQGDSVVGNSEGATIKFDHNGASGVLAANPSVILFAQNPTNVQGQSVPQIRALGAATLDKSVPLPPANSALGSMSPVSSGTTVQQLAAANSSSAYRFDFVNATTVTVTYTGNMLGDAGYTNRLGETFNESIGFGVRSAPLAKDDSYRVPTSGTTTASVLANDTMGGVTASTTNATVTATGAVPAGLTLNADGTITIAPNTAAGTYSIPYKVCSNPATTPESCATATATVVVAGSVPVNDSYPPIAAATGGATASVLANDKVNLGDGNGDVPAVLGTNATLTPGAAPATGLTMSADGTITVLANTAPGTYQYPYTLCVVPATTPPACAAATATVVVAPTPLAVHDTPPAAPSVVGGTTPSVLANDAVSGQPVVLGGANPNATFEPGSAPTPTAGSIKMDPTTGVVTIAPGTTPGTYSYPYTICSLPATTPPSCSTATATIVVAPTPLAVSDALPTVTTDAGGTTRSVLVNDSMSGQPIVLSGPGANATLTPGSSPNPGIVMNPDGTITVRPGTAVGTYTYSYKICSLPATEPASCSEAIATVVVGNVNPVPVGPWWLLTPGLLMLGMRRLRARR